MTCTAPPPSKLQLLSVGHRHPLSGTDQHALAFFGLFSLFRYMLSAYICCSNGFKRCVAHRRGRLSMHDVILLWWSCSSPKSASNVLDYIEAINRTLIDSGVTIVGDSRTDRITSSFDADAEETWPENHVYRNREEILTYEVLSDLDPNMYTRLC